MLDLRLPYRPPPARPMPSHVWGKGLFTVAELDRINAHAAGLPAQQVGVGKRLTYRPEVNRSLVRWLEPSPETIWIYQKILAVVATLNAQHYRFDVNGLDEPLYHVTYPAEQQGHYAWHTDVGASTRKLAITFQMTDPAAYDGGDLEINADGSIETAPRERGTLVLFPTYHVHRVTPVTRGTRSALVAWVVGPSFR